MTTMFTAILLAVLQARGIPATAYDNGALVAIDGRPGCTAIALHNDPSTPIVVCQ